MKTLSTEIISTKKNYALIESLLYKANEEFCCLEDRFRNVLIAVSELVMNAIVHGNKEEESKKVRVTVEYDKDIMRIKILDEGKGFDLYKGGEAALPDNVMKESGRGLYIVKSLVDEVEFKDTGQGTEIILTMRKKK
jgi:anti-sigma regulatory factor (Ser/Thr protein kinase)